MHENGRDAIVDRYVNGRMSPAEEEEFLRLAGNDPDLRHLVKAERIVRGSALQWREAISRSAGDPPPHLMARLVATPPMSPLPANGDSAIRKDRPLLSGGLLHGLMVALGIGCLAVGTFIIAPLIDASKPAPDARQGAERRPSNGPGSVPPASVRPAIPPSATVQPAHEKPAPTTSPRSPLRIDERSESSRRDSPDVPRQRQDTIRQQPMLRQDQLPVIVRDSLQLRLKIDSSRR